MPINIDHTDVLILAAAIIAHPIAKAVIEAVLTGFLNTNPAAKAAALEVAHTLEKAAGGDGQ